MRGLGKVGLTSMTVLVSYYFVTLPMGFIFAFLVSTNPYSDSKGMGINGLWLGMLMGQGVLCTLYQFFISIKINWEEVSKEMR